MYAYREFPDCSRSGCCVLSKIFLAFLKSVGASSCHLQRAAEAGRRKVRQRPSGCRRATAPKYRSACLLPRRHTDPELGPEIFRSTPRLRSSSDYPDNKLTYFILLRSPGRRQVEAYQRAPISRRGVDAAPDQPRPVRPRGHACWPSHAAAGRIWLFVAATVWHCRCPHRHGRRRC